MKNKYSVALLTLLLAAASLAVQAAGTPQQASAEARALNHIASFPGRSLTGPDHAYHLRDIIIDPNGSQHVRFDRSYKGLPVLGGDLVVHSAPNGALDRMSMTLHRLIDMKIKPTVSAARAVQSALAAHPGDNRNTPPSLLVYARADLPTLAWDVQVFGEQADGTPMEKHVIVDAHNALVLDAWDDIHTAAANGTGKGFFSGTVPLTTNSITGGYELRDPNRGGQYTVNMGNKTAGKTSIFNDTDNLWGSGALSDPATVAVDAQYGTAMTWDYFQSVHGRNGIANDGKGAYNRVHYGNRYNNAFWSDSCFCMTYGDGDGTTFNPFDSLDVAGHEMSHGVTSRTANLTYSGESGGLNEATSDIFGTMVEYFAGNANDPADYQIGEKLYKTGSKALRYMYQPSLDLSSADCWYSGMGSLDVHYSSGVANHFFYLLAEGSNPTNKLASPICKAGDTTKATGSGTVTGIGSGKAEKIWYRALTVYMTSSTDYKGARTATLNAAADLYGAGSTDYSAVAAAWSAVLVN